VAEWRSALPYGKNEQPPKVGNARVRLEWDHPLSEWDYFKFKDDLR
jgi:hypothetical protein